MLAAMPSDPQRVGLQMGVSAGGERPCMVMLEKVEPGSVVSTDELMSYGLLASDGFTHGAVKHSAKEWSWSDYRTGHTFSTNSVEGFWRLFKASVRSMHIHISAEKTPKYLAEFCYRSNHREFGSVMFDPLLSQV